DTDNAAGLLDRSNGAVAQVEARIADGAYGIVRRDDRPRVVLRDVEDVALGVFPRMGDVHDHSALEAGLDDLLSEGGEPDVRLLLELPPEYRRGGRRKPDLARGDPSKEQGGGGGRRHSHVRERADMI